VAVGAERVAFLSAIPQLAPKRYAFRLNAMVQVAMSLAQTVAPLAAVAIFTALGVTGILVVDAVSFAVASVVLALIRFPATLPSRRRESLRAEIVHGVRYVLGRPQLRELLLYFAVLSVFTAPTFLLVTPLVLPIGSVATIGTLVVLAGVGGIVGGLAMSLWGGPRRLMTGVLGSSILGGLAIATIGLRPSLPLIAVGLFCYLLAAAVFQTCYATIVQLKVPQLLQGRVFALVQMISLGAAPIAYLAAGPLGEKVFEPLLATDGPLAGSVGRVIGAGPGRGIALMYVIAGLVILTATVIAFRRPTLTHLEDALWGESAVGVRPLATSDASSTAAAGLAHAPTVPAPAATTREGADRRE
jgi:hypothetical protein